MTIGQSRKAKKEVSSGKPTRLSRGTRWRETDLRHSKRRLRSGCEESEDQPEDGQEQQVADEHPEAVRNEPGYFEAMHLFLAQALIRVVGFVDVLAGFEGWMRSLGLAIFGRYVEVAAAVIERIAAGFRCCRKVYDRFSVC